MSGYIANSIFNLMQVNAQLDRMYYEIGQAFPELDVNAVFALTGRAAAELQGAAPLPCQQIVFITNDATLYAWTGTVLPKKLSATGALRYVERNVLYLPGCVLEVWYHEGPLDIQLKNGAYVQNRNDINEILL